MNQTTGAARSPSAIIREPVPGELDAILCDVQQALPWLASGVPEFLAELRVYLLRFSTPSLRRGLGRRLVLGEDAGLQALVHHSWSRLRARTGRPDVA